MIGIRYVNVKSIKVVKDKQYIMFVFNTCN